jgi:hypothetical protein
MSGIGVSLGTVDLERATQATSGDAMGTVVVIDILRAFATAAFAFDTGAEAVTLVGEAGGRGRRHAAGLSSWSGRRPARDLVSVRSQGMERRDA